MRKILILTMVLGMGVAQAQVTDSGDMTGSVEGVTDWHCHPIPDSYREAVAAHNALLDEGFPLPQWSAEGHLQMMDATGIPSAVLTLPAPHPYWGDIEETKRLCRQFNEEMAEVCRQHPDRFSFCAVLPLPDVEAAIREAAYALDTLGAKGVKLATNVYGQYLGDSVLDPLMQFLSERHATVILHPHKPSPVNGAVMQQTPLAMQEYLSETTRAVCNMISRNVLARYPNMRVIVPHAGAYLSIALPRMRSLYPVMRQNGLVGDIDFEANIRCLYFDLAGSPSEETLQSLLTLASPDRLLYGSDYPYVAPQVIQANFERMKGHLTPNNNGLIVRMADISVHEQYLSEYLIAAQEVARQSVEKEEGVICLFPMQMNEPNTIRIVEVYRDEQAYKAHLQTPHFQAYKQGTLHMVKSLRMTDTTPLAPELLPLIFKKY